MKNEKEMRVEITLTKDQFQLFKSLGVIIENEYFHLPQYFKCIDRDEFEVLTFDELPDEAKDYIEALSEIKKKREEISKNDNGLMPEIRVH